MVDMMSGLFIKVIGGVFTGGLKATLPPSTQDGKDNLNQLLSAVGTFVPSINEYTGLIKGLLHGFGTYLNFQEQIKKVAPTLFDSLKIAIPLLGDIDLGEHLIKQIILGHGATGLLGTSDYLSQIIKPNEYSALTTLLRDGLLSMKPTQIDSVVTLLKKI